MNDPVPDRGATADIIEDLRLHQVELEVQLEELRRAEAQIAALGDRYRQLFDRAPVPLLTVDQHGVIHRANAAAEALLAAGNRLDGAPLVLNVAAEDHARLRPLLRHEDAAPRAASLVFRDRAGERIPCEVTASALPGDPGGRPAGGDAGSGQPALGQDGSGQHGSGQDELGQHVLLSLVDLREQERLAAVLAEAERSVAIRQLTGGIAHDFNNLLTVISGNLGLLEDEVVSEEGRGWLTAARTASERGGHLVAQLLAYARARSLDPQRCELPFLLEELQPLLASAVGESVSVTVDLDLDLPAVEVDPTHLQTAVLNLAINSRDAGSSTLRICGEVTDGRAVALTVADDGPGMPPEVVEQATTPFFTTKAGGTSSGLGLAMVASFVEASGGTLTLDSSPGQGTAVRFTLPHVHEPRQPSPRAAAPRRKGLQGSRILLVEDQEPVRNVTAALLNARGAQVTGVADAESALIEVAASAETDSPTPPIDAVLSDVVLGSGMDGIELQRQLATTPGAPPVVLVSGYVAGLEAVEDVVRKPYTGTQLADALVAAMAASGRGATHG